MGRTLNFSCFRLVIMISNRRGVDEMNYGAAARNIQAPIVNETLTVTSQNVGDSGVKRMLCIGKRFGHVPGEARNGGLSPLSPTTEIHIPEIRNGRVVAWTQWSGE